MYGVNDNDDEARHNLIKSKELFLNIYAKDIDNIKSFLEDLKNKFVTNVDEVL